MEYAVVSVATGVLTPVLGKLCTLLDKQNHCSKGMHDNVLSLKDELSSMNALLLKLADMDDLDIQIKVWRDQIRELSYDIEDSIDTFMHQVSGDSNSRENTEGMLPKIIQKVRRLQARKDMADKILQLKARVDNASERRRRYAFDEAVSSYTAVVSIDPRLPALYAEAETLVGIDEPREELIKWLTKEDGMSEQKLKVVSIVGLGGLGKTTLARQVYNNIGGQYDCRVFVSVSQKPDIKKIFRNMLIDITEVNYTGIESWDHQRLINRLREFLDDKRYFIIVDDIWSIPAWEIIKCAFPENSLGSRILTTTRNISVAETCCLPDLENVCKMKQLSDVDAEKLFVKRIFGSEDQCPSHLKELSIDILRKCGGLPLAIITVASLLASNKPCTKEQWERYRDSIVSATENYPNLENMRRILSLSYDDLPHYLKTCLLYLSTFPEDFLIWRDPLLRRWIAEGFITREGGRSLEEVGECYFNELINRSMIQPAEIQYDGQAYACRVHDMILDLIVSKSDKENFITLFGQNHGPEPQDKVRRLSLDCRDQDITMTSTMVLSGARSLTTYGSTENMPLLSDFHVLRAIAIEGNAKLQNRYLNDIGRLFQLKYLRLSEVSISELPEQIGRLKQLEALELRRTRIEEFPKSIVQLKKLVTLVADDIMLPEGIGNMKALQRLSGMRVNSSTPSNSLRELGGLTDLRNLWIIWSVSDTYSDQKSYTDGFVSCINELCGSKLRHLQVGCDTDGASLDFLLGSWPHPPYPLYSFLMTTYYCFPRIPEWMASLADVTFLDINLTSVGEEVLGILGGLSSLLSLSVTTQAIMSERLIFSSSGFQCLKEFYLHSWYEVVGPLLFEVGAMPKLEKFRFNLSALTAGSIDNDFYLGLQNMVRLKHLLVEVDCRESRAEQVEATEAAARKAIAINPLPSHLKIEIKRNWVNRIVKDEGPGSKGNTKPQEEREEKIHYN